MALLCCAWLVLLCVVHSASATVVADTDYGGVPLWIDLMLGEPSVLSLQGRMDPAWFRANNPQACPQHCDCPIHWPTALYCDHRGQAHIPDGLPDTTQYLFLQVRKTEWATEPVLSLHWSAWSSHCRDFPVSNLLFVLFHVEVRKPVFSQHNNISSLSSSGLVNITELRWLILDHNQLTSEALDRASLQNQTQLCYFFANHNHLTSVPDVLPAGLRQLRLAHNQISSIRPGAFQKLHNLTLLLLQGNRLQTITEGDLRGSGMCHFLSIHASHIPLYTLDKPQERLSQPRADVFYLHKVQWLGTVACICYSYLGQSLIWITISYSREPQPRGWLRNVTTINKVITTVIHNIRTIFKVDFNEKCQQDPRRQKSFFLDLLKLTLIPSRLTVSDNLLFYILHGFKRVTGVKGLCNSTVVSVGIIKSYILSPISFDSSFFHLRCEITLEMKMKSIKITFKVCKEKAKLQLQCAAWTLVRTIFQWNLLHLIEQVGHL